MTQNKIKLDKGDKIDLTKASPSLKRIRVGLGWKEQTAGNDDFDLDVSAFGLHFNESGEPKMPTDDWIIFYNNLVSPLKAIVHMGDDRIGGDDDSDQDNETVIVDLTKLPANIDEISFVVTIHEAIARRQSFGQIEKSYIAIYNDETGIELSRYDLDEHFSLETAVQFGSLYQKNGNWNFKAIGAGYRIGLRDFIKGYGGNV